jgi:hypothetical protein
MIRKASRASIVGVITVLATMAATPAFAAKGGGTPAPTTSSIALNTVSGVAAAAPDAQTPSAKLGDVLTFKTTVEPLAGWEYPLVSLSCYQDVNGDHTVDTNLLGPDIVFSWLDKPDANYPLGGYSSIWKMRGGGAATCRAELDAYGWKGGKQSVRVLASTGDWAAAG